MTDQVERFDRYAGGYDEWWAPVLAPSAHRLLEQLDEDVAAGATSLLDVGVGTGNLAIPALARWPSVRVTGVDPSSEMIGAVEALVGDRLPQGGDRFRGEIAFAAELPFADETFDAAMSSFVLQLVPSRPKALREIHRVLRPTGRFAYVTWLVDDRAFAPDRIFDQLLDEAGFDDAIDPPRSGDIPSVERAAAELRRAGFRDVEASAGMLDHAYTVDGYISFLTEFDEEALFEEMSRTERRQFLIRLRERLMALRPEELRFRVPIVYASGRRSS
jgi:ubiquinone/menaquinone biosynthesis C-methylase UbiE